MKQKQLAHRSGFSHKSACHWAARQTDACQRKWIISGYMLLYDRSKLEETFLPVGSMLQLDRVTSIAGSRLTAEMEIKDHWVWPFHFPSDPIFPGSLLIEAAGQSVAVWAWHAGMRGKPRMLKVDAKFRAPAFPADGLITFCATVHHRRNIVMGNVEVTAGERLLAHIRPMIIVIAG